VLVVQDRRIVHKKGYGLADIAANAPITPNTAFDLGSISKPFTAMAIMMLAERGELRYGDPLSRFFPEFPSYARKITIWHLLHHSHGFPDYEGLFVKSGMIDKDYPRPSKGKEEGFEPTIRDTLRLLAQQKELRFAPGDKYEYGGSGYVLLALIIEKVSGKPYSRFLKENIFRPLGMNSTLVYDETRPKVKNKAVSYSRVGERYKDIDYTPLNLIYGDGNVNSTVEDLYKWDQALYTDRLLRAETLEQAFTPGKLNDGMDTGYGSRMVGQELSRIAAHCTWRIMGGLQEPAGTLSRPASYDHIALQFRRVRPRNFGLQNRQDISGRSDGLADRGEGRARGFAEICWQVHVVRMGSCRGNRLRGYVGSGSIFRCDAGA